MSNKLLKCPHCDAEWKPRKPSPLRCPRCWLPLKKKAEKAA
jgi:uncharacterized Zn-finger protein